MTALILHHPAMVRYPQSLESSTEDATEEPGQTLSHGGGSWNRGGEGQRVSRALLETKGWSEV